MPTSNGLWIRVSYCIVFFLYFALTVGVHIWKNLHFLLLFEHWQQCVIYSLTSIFLSVVLSTCDLRSRSASSPTGRDAEKEDNNDLRHLHNKSTGDLPDRPTTTTGLLTRVARRTRIGRLMRTASFGRTASIRPTRIPLSSSTSETCHRGWVLFRFYYFHSRSTLYVHWGINEKK